MTLIQLITRQVKTKCPVLHCLWDTPYYPTHAEWFDLMDLINTEGIDRETRLTYLLFLLEYLED